MPASILASTFCLNSASSCAIAALSTIIASAQLSEEPTARNSNRLPVNANGEVRLRSVLSSSSVGICEIPLILNTFLASKRIASSPLLAASLSSTADTCVPRKVEMIAGGASLAPRRCAFVALMIAALSRPLCLCTAEMAFTRKVMNCRFSEAVLPGPSRFTPVSVPSDQLLCLPEPLIPLKGLSCSSTRNL